MNNDFNKENRDKEQDIIDSINNRSSITNNQNQKKHNKTHNKKKISSVSANEQQNNKKIDYNPSNTDILKISEKKTQNSTDSDNKSIPEIDKKAEEKKRKRKDIFICIYGILIVALLSVGIFYLLTNERFEITNHEIKGIVYANPGLIEEAATKCHYKNIFILNKQKIIKQKKHIREIDKITVKRKFPNTIIIIVTEKKPVCCFQTKSGKYLITNKGLCFHKLSEKEKINNIPMVIDNNNLISLGNNIVNDITEEKTKNHTKKLKELESKKHKKHTDKEKTVVKNKILKQQIFQEQFLFELARTCYNNNLNIKKIIIKNQWEVILWSGNNTIIKFGSTSDILDKTYLLKQIYLQKKDILKDMKEINIINSRIISYKLKNKPETLNN